MSTRKGIGYSPLTERVFLGKQNREKGMWIGEKEDITSDFIGVVLQWVGDNECRTIRGGNTDNLIVNCLDDKESIEKVIKHLQGRLKEKEGTVGF